MLGLVFTLGWPIDGLARKPEKICPFLDWPNRCVVPGLQVGDRVPIAGDLFTVDYAIWLNHEVDGLQRRIDAAVTATAASFREDLRFQAQVYRADRERDAKVHAAEVDALKRQLPQWYERPWFVATASAVVTAAVAAVLFSSLNRNDTVIVTR